MIGATLTPFWNETFLPGAWNPRREAVREAVNAWLREGTRSMRWSISTGRCATRNSPRDAAEIRLRRPSAPERSRLPPMGDAIDLALFD